MIRRPPRSTPKPSSAASDVYKRQNVRNLWLEDCGQSTLAGMFLPQDIRLTYTNPFKPSKIKYLTYFDNTIEYKAKFTALYDTHFKPYGYEVD